MAIAAMESACIDVGFGWDETEGVKKGGRATKVRRPDHIQPLADCKQGDVVLVDGREMRVAWFIGKSRETVVLYPDADRHIIRDPSNLRVVSCRTSCRAVRLQP